MNQEGKRINKFLSEVGFCSRRKADVLIEEKRVTINNKIPEKGTKVFHNDIIKIDGKTILFNQFKKKIYIVFNKPIGVVCTTDTSKEKDNIIDFINYPSRIFPIGRLDKPSEGLIFLTNDGDIVNKILRSRNNHEKEYIVSVNKPITNQFIKKMKTGVPILDTITKECFVEQIGIKKFRIVLTQGLNRQIRRMCEYLGFRVTKLKRVRIMNIELDIPVGQWRYFSDNELKNILKLCEKSSKKE